MDLALEAETSTRHLSCLETGRAQPSREMVVRLAETLRVPLRERNALLLAAGYAPLYRDTALDAPELKAARHAVELFMTGLEPNPVLVLDRYWNSLRMNAGAKRILACFPAAILVRLTMESGLYSIPKGCDRSSKTGRPSPPASFAGYIAKP